jgi:2-methylcitrate dehydratase PrpD
MHEGDEQPRVTDRLAAFSAALSYDDLPDQVRARARLFVLDGIGVMLGAVAFAEHEGDHTLEAYLDAVAPDGSATVVGTPRMTSPMMAGFANGTRSEVLDSQDTNIECRIHNGAAIIPTALAMGEVTDASGRDVMAAAVAGYEVGCRLAKAIQPAHWYAGFQITGTYNTCGSAATAGRLLGFNAEEMAAGLGISGFILPISNGDNVFKGHSIKPVHGGQPALCGISAAYLAKAGYRAGPLEGEPPRYHAALHILGCDRPDLAESVRDIGERWHSLEVGFKPYPVGLFINGPVEVCLALLAEAPIRAEDVQDALITTYHDGCKFTGEKYTTTRSNYVDAHLSMPYCVAVTLTDGAMSWQQLTGARLADPAVHELASRVKVVESDAMNRMYPHEWPLEVEVRLRDGSVRSKRVDQVRWSPRRPPTWPEMSVKFHAMADPVLGAERAQQAIDLVAGLDDAASIKPLLRLAAR